jgi:hypothetical protein
MEPTGWFADIDPDVDHRWQPCLQLGGWCPSMPVWFKSEQECLDFIRDEIIGQGMYDQ